MLLVTSLINAPFLTSYTYAVGHLWHIVSTVRLAVRLSRMYCG